MQSKQSKDPSELEIPLYILTLSYVEIHISWGYLPFFNNSFEKTEFLYWNIKVKSCNVVSLFYFSIISLFTMHLNTFFYIGSGSSVGWTFNIFIKWPSLNTYLAKCRDNIIGQQNMYYYVDIKRYAVNSSSIG